MKIKDISTIQSLYGELLRLRESAKNDDFFVTPSHGLYKCPILKEKALYLFRKREQEILNELKELGVEIDDWKRINWKIYRTK